LSRLGNFRGSTDDVKAALKEAHVPPATADEIVKQNEKSQIDGLRAAEALLALNDGMERVGASNPFPLPQGPAIPSTGCRARRHTRA
jgi:hypothetical protein